MRVVGATALLLLVAGVAACEIPVDGRRGRSENVPERHESLPEPIDRDLPAIEASDTLVALLASNSTSYFIYRGEPMGYEYDLLRRFAADRELALRVVVVDSPRAIFRMLNRGDGDVAAARIVALPTDTPGVAFTGGLYSTGPAIVAATDTAPAPSDSAGSGRGRPGRPTRGDGEEGRLLRRMGGRSLTPDTLRIRARLMRSPSERRADSAYVPLGSEYYGRLVELVDSTGTPVEVVELEDAPSYEDLIERVAAGAIRLAVSPENLAQLNRGSYTEITVRETGAPTDTVTWAVRRNAPALRDTLTTWLNEPDNARFLNDRYFAYFVDRAAYAERARSEFMTTETGQISRYDSLLVKHADRIGWDWRLLAAQTAQESRFDARARSWAGARGLLQLMPRTAREMGVRDPTDPDQNVAGAVRYLEWLERAWARDIADPEERRRFVLASYNAGRGHVEDARRLARKYGDDPDRWEDVAFWMIQKGTRRYSRDPVVRYGYVRGTEPVNYVSRILERYDAYLASGLFREGSGARGPGADSARAGRGPLFRGRGGPDRGGGEGRDPR